MTNQQIEEQCATLPLAVAARRLGLSVRTVKAAIARGEVPAIRIGRGFLVLREAFEQMLSGSVTEQQEDPMR